MSHQLTGKIIEIYDVQQVTERFKKREFVIEMQEEYGGNTYSQYAKMQCTNAKCDLLATYQVGEEVKASFNVRGNRYEKDGKVSYFTTLECWKLESVAKNVPQQQPMTEAIYNPQTQPASQPSSFTPKAPTGKDTSGQWFNTMNDDKDDLPF